VSDAALREAILKRVWEQPWAHPSLVNVIVQGGVVNLWGSVTSESERDALRILVQETLGVASVNDHLAIQRFRTAI
jgi:osmotically-inducible protein OsmY